MPAIDRSPVILETAPRQRRSVFGNYLPAENSGNAVAETGLPEDLGSAAPVGGGANLALARCFLHQFLARAFDYPVAEAWTWLTSPSIQQTLAVAVSVLEAEGRAALRVAQEALAGACVPDAFERFHDAYVTAIGHAARGSCPINEIEYGDLKADPLFQPHRLADLAAFYHAFGLEIGALSDERLDHLSVELEFMAVLTAQEANLLSTGCESDRGRPELQSVDGPSLTRPSASARGATADKSGTLSRRTGAGRGEGHFMRSEALVVCRDAQRKFLREHLGRWTPAFARRLHRAVGESPLGALALFALAFLELECRRVGVTPGSEELLLRPADEGASLCDGCGLTNSLPGTVVSV